MINQNQIEKATLEAIYWWNRTEHLNHQRFKNLDLLLAEEKYTNVVLEKIIKPFLGEYSVRRNLGEGDENILKFLKQIIEINFINKVKDGKIEVIDETSDLFKNEGFTSNRSTISLLSKMAFLINPSDFSLYDTLARNSLKTLLLERKNNFLSKDIEVYTEFHKWTVQIKDEISDKGGFKISFEILNIYKQNAAYEFFSTNRKAFELRIIDKLLWLMQQPRIDNSSLAEIYRKFGI